MPRIWNAGSVLTTPLFLSSIRMTPSVLYHCTCTSASTSANYPPAHTSASSSYAFHPLHTLFFCEECDLVRCNRCVRVEVSCYYCPNCLFEVPTASVRGENNRYVTGLDTRRLGLIQLSLIVQMCSKLFSMPTLLQHPLCRPFRSARVCATTAATTVS